jgi:orotidine-5'-phosphate decarboxylase
MADFAERFVQLAQVRSSLCLGLDPSAELLKLWGLEDDAEGLKRFCETVLEAAGDTVSVVKPQAGFFERFGPPGMVELGRVVGRIREQGALSLIDGKRGDVPGTMEGYAEAMIGDGKGFGADAMTVAPYLGFDALRPALDRAAANGAAVFVVVRSSNADGRSLQDARHPDGRTVAEALADHISAFNAKCGPGAGPIGAVIGATIDEAGARILARLPQSLVLAPGVGAQGASVADVEATFGRSLLRTLPSVSRAILREGPTVQGLRGAIGRFRDQVWKACERAARADPLAR